MKNLLSLIPEIIQVLGKIIQPKTIEDRIKWKEWKNKSKFDKKRKRVEWRQERRKLRKNKNTKNTNK